MYCINDMFFLHTHTHRMIQGNYIYSTFIVYVIFYISIYNSFIYLYNFLWWTRPTGETT